jgi:uncharacterized protein (TIGR02145 family)
VNNNNDYYFFLTIIYMNKNLVLVMLLLVATVSAQAQVTIGDLKNPETFSILELVSGSESNNGNRGLRLPQLTTVERETMQETDDFKNEKTDKAVGLQIYNTTTRCVETWNGTKWIQKCGHYGPRPLTGQLAISITGSEITYRDFMAYNLGAQEISIKEQLMHVSPTTNAIPGTDEEKDAYTKVYGSLYQWGRKSDGHENVWIAAATTPTTGVPAAGIDEYGQVKSGVAGYGQFVKNTAAKYDWIANDAPVSGNYQSFPGRWDGGNNTSYAPPTEPFPSSKVKEPHGNDPCPAGFRVPSKVEWASIVNISNLANGINKWVWVAKGATFVVGVDLEGGTVQTSGYLIYPAAEASSGAATSHYETPALFLPAAGYRSGSVGSLGIGGSDGYYWSSTAYSSASFAYGYYLLFDSDGVVPTIGNLRASGYSVRCVAD